MISMTGYTKLDFKIEDKRFSIIIKALNSNRGLDINIKIPRNWMILENELKKMIENQLIRGKIDFKIIDNNNASETYFNKQKLNAHIKSIKHMIPDLKSEAVLNIAIKFPDIFTPQIFSLNSIIKKEVFKKIMIALHNLDQFRQKEGNALMKEIKLYINMISKVSKQLVSLELKRIKLKKSKILNQIKKEKLEYNPSKLESEMIYYFEKNDITEERIRLQHHILFFREVMKSEIIVGKKLTFITQEMLREINTIGSKANDFEIQKRVVVMKEQVEKIKEQLQNIL